MAKIQFNGEVLHYLIMDAGDGSASLVFFANQEALDLYLEKKDYCEDLSEGGSFIDQSDVDSAMTVQDVIDEFGDDEEGEDE